VTSLFFSNYRASVSLLSVGVDWPDGRTVSNSSGPFLPFLDYGERNKADLSSGWERYEWKRTEVNEGYYTRNFGGGCL
jgi:hypothetical protein